jgi:hypothetical protein
MMLLTWAFIEMFALLDFLSIDSDLYTSVPFLKVLYILTL